MPVKSRAKTGRRIPGSKSRGKTMKVTKIVKVREPKLQTKSDDYGRSESDAESEG